MFNLDGYLSRELEEARERASFGDFYGVGLAISKASRLSNLTGTDIGSQIRDIEMLARERSIPRCLNIAREKAIEGNPISASSWIRIAETYAKGCSRSVSEEEKMEIERTSYENGVGVILDKIKGFFLNGKKAAVIVYTSIVNDYARKLGWDISEDLEECFA